METWECRSSQMGGLLGKRRLGCGCIPGAHGHALVFAASSKGARGPRSIDTENVKSGMK